MSCGRSPQAISAGENALNVYAFNGIRVRPELLHNQAAQLRLAA